MPERRALAAEFLGTFVLVAIGPGASMVAARTGAFGHQGVALAFGLAVLMIVAALGPVSGAHVNPAVTIGLWSVRRLDARAVLPYVVAQCAGAVVAAIALSWLLGPVVRAGVTLPAVGLERALAVEAAYSALLGFVILAATSPRAVPGLAPLLIGATVCAGALVTGPLTGGSFNPARSLGPAVAAGVWTAHWLYWVAPVAGMALGMHAHRVLAPNVRSTG